MLAGWVMVAAAGQAAAQSTRPGSTSAARALTGKITPGPGGPGLNIDARADALARKVIIEKADAVVSAAFGAGGL